MNKQAMSASRQAQSGFTLIELIVVIVILGILAATALPRFSNLGRDARVASLSAVRGALASTSASAHGSWLINPANPVVFEGQTVAMTAGGYPTADAALLAASGITAADYTIIGGGGAAVAATTTAPAAAINTFSVVPNSVAGTAVAVSCFVNYAQSTGANTQPVISPLPAVTNC